jgi:predicted O-methyltransferase YrrM
MLTMLQNEDTYCSLSELNLRKVLPYRRTFEFPNDYINDRHKFFTTCPRGRMGIDSNIDLGIDGYLLPEDALKLYELVYFCKGNILQLGTYKGLSTYIITMAMDDSHSQGYLDTVDIDENVSTIAQNIIKDLSYNRFVNFYVMDAMELCDKKIVEKKHYDFIFIDHWHGYDATYSAAIRAKKLLNVGGFCLFHDYGDPGNADPDHVYGVYQAAHDAMLCDEHFEFYGAFGCTGLFRKNDGS